MGGSHTSARLHRSCFPPQCFVKQVGSYSIQTVCKSLWQLTKTDFSSAVLAEPTRFWLFDLFDLDATPRGLLLLSLPRLTVHDGVALPDVGEELISEPLPLARPLSPLQKAHRNTHPERQLYLVLRGRKKKTRSIFLWAKKKSTEPGESKHTPRVFYCENVVLTVTTHSRVWIKG